MSRRTTCGPGGLAGLNSAQGSGPGTLAPSAMNGEGFEVFGLRSSVPGSATLQDSWWSFLARSLFFRGATTTKEPPAQLAVTAFYILVLPTPKFRPKGCTTIVYVQDFETALTSKAEH
ncbi:hypothetical protein F441_19620 [Phytophthora nicotianae CJ01A1]|uniref:Uncharacterized protein n=1 Tax=Phytophthora nicotianae CJ01A1 TaxID=1317063 RepID=W2W1E6_PHYNI|nr:hypothetical protein F441_19620 [Phytophthora nicotianae CJ01A1]